MKALAPAPERSTNSMSLGWSIMTIPCSVYTGTEPVNVQRKEFVVGTDHAVGRVSIDKVTNVVIDRADVVKMAEATSGVFVELDDDEIAACTTDRGLATIVGFVPAAKLHKEYLLDGLSQVRPRRVKGKTDPGAEKALRLLFDTMAARKVVALVQVALRGPARYAILDAQGDMRWVVTADSIRIQREQPIGVITDQERDLASSLVDAIGVGTPTLVDTSAKAIQAYVDNKAQGIVPAAVATPDTAPADLLSDLLASIDAEKGRKAS